MKLHQMMVIAVASLLALTGCKSNDDLVASKDREISEKQAENDALRRRLSDGESVRLVMDKQLKEREAALSSAQADRDRFRDEQGRLANEVATLRNRPEPAPGDRVTNPAPGLEVIERNGELVLRLDNAVTFSSGSAILTDGGQRLLRKEVAKILKEHGGHRVSVEGHTDDVPIKRSRWKNNLNLSIARAIEVRRFLAAQLKVTAKKMRVVGYGDTKPVMTKKTKKARAKNRRVEIVLYKEASDN
ncbi:MAG: hypothetical protein CMJ83_20990 [Planctomycetes bacterium]|nr:hypothetical protein [Planctomycetota bacterium]